MLRPFHHAFVVNDLDKAKEFYQDVLGCSLGRSADQWIDIDFFGHQISAHLHTERTPKIRNAVEGDAIPVPHFGVILQTEEFKELEARLKSADITFLIPPKTRFAGKAGEQRTMFFADPAGNVIEIKSFDRADGIFSREYSASGH